jgi:hypothetical protein
MIGGILKTNQKIVKQIITEILKTVHLEQFNISNG